MNNIQQGQLPPGIPRWGILFGPVQPYIKYDFIAGAKVVIVKAPPNNPIDKWIEEVVEKICPTNHQKDV